MRDVEKASWRGVSFQSAENLLRGLIYEPREVKCREGAVICHPHPLYGGDMRNQIVASIGEALASLGIFVLRFDFRGAGQSEGDHDGEREVDDVAAATEFLAKEAGGLERIHLVGYSWGLLMALKLCDRERGFSDVCGVAPPVGFLDCSGVGSSGAGKYFVLGERDRFAPLPLTLQWIKGLGGKVEYEIMSNADHFFFGREADVAEKISMFLRKRICIANFTP